MSTTKIFCSAIVASLLASTALEASETETGADERVSNPDIRRKFGGRENTPDHVMFAFLVRYITNHYEEDEVFARSIVMDNMQFGPVEAKVLIQHLIVTEAQLRNSIHLAREDKLCKNAAMRTRPEHYRALSDLDSEKLWIEKNVYEDFVSALDKVDKRKLEAWLDDEKDGYGRIEFDHAKLYERHGLDVGTFVQTLCDKAAEAQKE